MTDIPSSVQVGEPQALLAPDHLLRKQLNALLPLGAGVLRLPRDNFDGSSNGGYHHAADWR